MNPFRAASLALLALSAAACDPIVLIHVRVAVPAGVPLPPAASLRVEMTATPLPVHPPERPVEVRAPAAVHATPDGRGYEFDLATGIGRCFRVRLYVWADENGNGQVDLRELVGESDEAFDVCRRGFLTDVRHDAPPIELRPFWPPP